MLMINDYQCNECGNIDEHFIDSSVESTSCTKCTGSTSKKITGTRIDQRRMERDGGFPTASARFDKRHGIK